MAARTSLYSTALQMPKWVFSGDYGDVSNTLNNRDISYENSAQEELATQQGRLNLEDAQRKERMREILKEDTANARPATIRDAYQQMIDSAYEAGDPVMAMDYESKRQAYEESQVNKRRAELAGAIGLADNLGYDRVNQAYPGVLTPDDYARNQKKARVLREGKHAMVNSKTGEIDPEVPYSEAMAKQKTGEWKFLRGQTASSPLNIAGINGDAAGTEGGGNWIGETYDSFFGGKPGEAAAKAQEKAVKDLQKEAPGKGAEKTRAPASAEKPITATNPKTGQVVRWNAAKRVWE